MSGEEENSEGVFIEEQNPEQQILVYGEHEEPYVLNLVDGQYYVSNGQAVLLQENEGDDFTQFYVNNDTSCDGESFICQPVNDDSSNVNDDGANVIDLDDETSEGARFVQYVQDGAVTTTTEEDGNSVIYLTDDGHVTDDTDVYPLKRIKLEGQMLDFEDFIQQQQDGDEDGGFRFELVDGAEYLTCKPEVMDDYLDLSKITGKNLITGQTVTLHGYMEKLKRKLSDDGPEKPAIRSRQMTVQQMSRFQDLIDKKIAIGRTKSGKRLVGKIIHVGRKDPDVSPVSDDVPSVIDDVTDEETRTKETSISEESFEQISKTLSGVMEMESVRKKIENRNVTVKLTEKHSIEGSGYRKTVSYCRGYMESDGGEWRFVPDLNDDMRYPLTAGVAISISGDGKGARSVRVNLNPRAGDSCDFGPCACADCGKEFASRARLERHAPAHSVYASPRRCGACGARCSSACALGRHEAEHGGVAAPPSSCDVCRRRFASRRGLDFHKRTHYPEKHFVCEVCLRTFSRHSNLSRHMVIHQGDGALYKCEICSCSYNYVSSLTRHMVQNHIDVRDFRGRIQKI